MSVSTQNSFDTGPLSWVKAEIEHSLNEARANLDKLLADPADAKVQKFVATHLHQVTGALSMVGLGAATRFNEEIEKLVATFETDPANARADAANRIACTKKATSALSSYLDTLSASGVDRPMMLAPAYVALNQVQGLKDASESDLFSPDLSTQIPMQDETVALPKQEMMVEAIKQRRGMYQGGLLKLLRDKDMQGGARDMRNATLAIEALQIMSPSRSFWFTASGFFDAIANSPTEAGSTAVALFGKIDQQIKLLIEGVHKVPERLFRDLLLIIGKSTAKTERIKRIREIYRLDELLAEPDSARLENDDQLAGVIRQMREQVTIQKEDWLKYTSGNRGALESFAKIGEGLVAAAGNQPNAKLTQLLQVLAAVGPHLRKVGIPPNESQSLEVATAMLFLETSLENYNQLGADFATQSATVVTRVKGAMTGAVLPAMDPASSGMVDSMTKRAQERLLMFQVGQEIQINLQSVETVLDNFFREPAKVAELATLSPLFSQVQGALMILELDEAAVLNQQLSSRVAQFASGALKGAGDDAEAVAEGVSALGLYVTALQQGQANPREALLPALIRFGLAAKPAEIERSLIQSPITHGDVDVAKQKVQELYEDWKQSPEQTTTRDQLREAVKELNQGALLVSDSVSAKQSEDALKAIDQSFDPSRSGISEAMKDIEPTNPTTAPAAQTVHLVDAPTDEVDQELLDIFLEEATEVVATIQENLATIRANPQDKEALITIRRGYHTLKGSGRMVGLNDLGEVGWQCEQVLNKVLKEEKAPSTGLLEFIDVSSHSFSGWVTALQSNGSARINGAMIVRAADALKNGKEPDFTAIPDAIAVTAAPIPTPVAAPAVPVIIETPAPIVMATPADSFSFGELGGIAAGVGGLAGIAGLSLDLGAKDVPAEPVPTFADPIPELAAPLAVELPPAIVEPSPAVDFDLFAEDFATPAVVTAPVPEIAEVDFELFVEAPALSSEPVAASIPVDAPAAPIEAPIIATAIEPAVEEVDPFAALFANEVAPVEATPPRMLEALRVVPDAELQALVDAEKARIAAASAPTMLLKTIAPPLSAPLVPEMEMPSMPPPLPVAQIEVPPPIPTEPSGFNFDFDAGSIGLAGLGAVAGVAALSGAASAPEVAQTTPIEADVAAPAASLPAMADDEMNIGGNIIPIALFEIYMSEADLHAVTLDSEMATLEFNPLLPVTHDFMRAAHTLTGSSRTTGFDAISDVAHALEKWLKELIENPIDLNPQRLELTRRAVDTLGTMVFGLHDKEAPDAEPALIAELVAMREEAQFAKRGEITHTRTPVAAEPSVAPSFMAPSFVAEPFVADPAVFELTSESVSEPVAAPSVETFAVEAFAFDAAPIEVPPAAEIPAFEAFAAIPDVAAAPADVTDLFAPTPVVEAVAEPEPIAEEVAFDDSAFFTDLPTADSITFEPITVEPLAAVTEPAVELPVFEAPVAEVADQPVAAEPTVELVVEPVSDAIQVDTVSLFDTPEVPEIAEAPQKTDSSFMDSITGAAGIGGIVGLAGLAGAAAFSAPASAPLPAPTPPPASIIAPPVFIPLTPQAAQPAPLFETAAFESGKERRAIVDDIDMDLLPIFVEEAREIIPQLGESLRTWRTTPVNHAPVGEMTRYLHTLKGSSRMAGLMRLGELAHVIETKVLVMDRVAEPAATDYDEVEAAVDRFSSTLERLATGDMAPMPIDIPVLSQTSMDLPAPIAAMAAVRNEITAEGERQEGRERQALLRVNASMIDRFVNEAGEMAIARSRIDQEMITFKRALLELTQNIGRMKTQLREIEIQAETQIQSRQKEAEEHGAQFDPLEFDRFSRTQELTRFMAESLSDVVSLQQSLQKNLDEADAALLHQSRLNRDLQQGLMGVRLVPLGNLQDRFYRLVRQTAKELGKKVNLEFRGVRVEIDRSVLEKITAPFEHLLRNAVAHGLEMPEARGRAGKDEIGEIGIDAQQIGNEILLTLTDDGAGLNFPRIREKAIAQGLLDANAEVTDQQLTQYIFMSGFSTANEVTQIAGRGVGMDVVRNEIVSLGGRVDITSTPGKGTSFFVSLPLTLAVTQAVMVRVGETLYAIPSVMVEQVQEYKGKRYEPLLALSEIDWKGNRYPLRSMEALLGGKPRLSVVNKASVILAKSGQQRAALQVDEIIGNREIVVKTIGPQLARMVGISGATVMGNGQVILILNPVQLVYREAGTVTVEKPMQAANDGFAPSAEVQIPMETLQAAQGPSLAETIAANMFDDSGVATAAPIIERTTPLVMVVDDSLTVRKITSRMLLRESYEVATAKDGVDALQQLQDIMPDIILLDIEMPRMDGFEFARNMRADAKLRNIPIIMITSRTADKHRNHAIELGVNEYMGKPYQEEQLLALIKQYTQHRRIG